MFRKFITDDESTEENALTGIDEVIDEAIQDQEEDELYDETFDYDKVKDKKSKKKLRGFRLVRRIFTIVCLLGLLLFIGVSIYNSVLGLQMQGMINSIDSRLDSYEYSSDKVKSVAKLLTIHDKDSYKSAMNSINMTNELKQRYFPDDEFTGTDSEASDYEIVDIQYQYEPNESTQTYLMTVNVTKKNGVLKTYYMVCAFEGSVLSALAIY